LIKILVRFLLRFQLRFQLKGYFFRTTCAWKKRGYCSSTPFINAKGALIKAILNSVHLRKLQSVLSYNWIYKHASPRCY